MAIDLFLTDSGDFSFTTNVVTSSSNEGFSYSFHVAPTSSLLLNFYTENQTKPITDNYFTYNFYAYTPKNDKNIKIVSGRSFIYQNIKLRISTEINTVRANWDMGCDLHTVMHSSLPDTRLCSTIEKMIRDSIRDLIPEASVSVTLLNTNYLDYHDSIKVVIINDEDVFYYVI